MPAFMLFVCFPSSLHLGLVSSIIAGVCGPLCTRGCSIFLDALFPVAFVACCPHSDDC